MDVGGVDVDSADVGGGGEEGVGSAEAEVVGGGADSLGDGIEASSLRVR